MQPKTVQNNISNRISDVMKNSSSPLVVGRSDLTYSLLKSGPFNKFHSAETRKFLWFGLVGEKRWDSPIKMIFTLANPHNSKPIS